MKMKVEGGRVVTEQTTYTIGEEALLDLLKRLGFTIPDDATVEISPKSSLVFPIIIKVMRTTHTGVSQAQAAGVVEDK